MATTTCAQFREQCVLYLYPTPRRLPRKKPRSRFPAFLDKNMPQRKRDLASASPTTLEIHQLFLQKLTEIHLRSHLDEEMEEMGHHPRLCLRAIALFILLIACINYMNLSTARSTLRAKEIGIRKVAGARAGRDHYPVPQRIGAHRPAGYPAGHRHYLAYPALAQDDHRSGAYHRWSFEMGDHPAPAPRPLYDRHPLGSLSACSCPPSNR